MKFKGQPNLFVRISNKIVIRNTGKKGFYFDNNGEYETDNPLLARYIKQSFEVVKEDPIPEAAEEIQAETIKPVTVFECKKCNYKTSISMGVLLAHYRKEHPKS
jgi:hypothetical protein